MPWWPSARSISAVDKGLPQHGLRAIEYGAKSPPPGKISQILLEHGSQASIDRAITLAKGQSSGTDRTSVRQLANDRPLSSWFTEAANSQSQSSPCQDTEQSVLLEGCMVARNSIFPVYKEQDVYWRIQHAQLQQL